MEAGRAVIPEMWLPVGCRRGRTFFLVGEIRKETGREDFKEPLKAVTIWAEGEGAGHFPGRCHCLSKDMVCGGRLDASRDTASQFDRTRDSGRADTEEKTRKTVGG